MSGAAPAKQPPRAPPRASTEERARQIDAGLVQRCRRGDEAARAMIVDRFSSYVYAIATRYGLGDDRVQDVYQEVFTRAFTHLDSLRDDGALKPWLAQLTRRAAVDSLRAARRELPSAEADVAAEEDPDFEELERAMSVQRALDALPEPFGEALQRFFLHEQSYRTISDALGIPAGTVASRISRGLSMLRMALDPDPDQADA